MSTASIDAKINHIKQWLGAGSINIFGLPFAGKDTHGRELAKIFGAPLIGGGEIIRSDLTPQHMKDHIAKGMLTPTDEYLQLILPYLDRAEFKPKPLVLNSVGRWFGEHEQVVKAADKAGHPIKAVLYIVVDTPEVLKRWESEQNRHDRGHRHDDAEHILETRISEFESKTLPVIEFYRRQNLLIEIDGTADRNTATAQIMDKLYEKSL